MSNPFHPNAVKHNIVITTPKPRTSKATWAVIYFFGCLAVLIITLFGLCSP